MPQIRVVRAPRALGGLPASGPAAASLPAPSPQAAGAVPWPVTDAVTVPVADAEPEPVTSSISATPSVPAAGPEATGEQRLRRVEQAMGTVFSFDVRGGDPRRVNAALEGAVEWLHHVDAVFSTYRPESQISRLAAGTLALSACSPEVWEVHRLCDEARRTTGGWFDAGYAGGFDPTGLVKGWAVERAAAMLRSAGAEAVCVNGGGDVQVHGGPWRIGITHPLRRGTLATAVQADGDLAVATSGSAERGAHILDPRTHLPVAPVFASVTVVCRGLTDADVLATAACAMGAAAPGWLRTLPATEAFAVRPDGTTWCTQGFAGRHS